jgi:hypothetical protein
MWQNEIVWVDIKFKIVLCTITPLTWYKEIILNFMKIIVISPCTTLSKILKIFGWICEMHASERMLEYGKTQQHNVIP